MTKIITIDWDDDMDSWKMHNYNFALGLKAEKIEYRKSARKGHHIRISLSEDLNFRNEMVLRLSLGDDLKRVAEDIRRHEMGKNHGLLFDVKIWKGNKVRKAGPWKVLK